MNRCTHAIDGFCQVASKIAVVSCPLNTATCNACLKSDSPMQSNPATIGLARVTLRSLKMPYEHLYPDEVRELIAVAEQDESPLTLIDGMGRAFMRELPWVDAHRSGCDCFSFLRVLNKWGPDKSVDQRARIVGWFMGIAKQLGVTTTAQEIELAIFRAAELIRHRDEDAVAAWPFLFTYYAAGAVADELKYSIRSVLHHQPGARIIVIGDKPEWYAG